MKNKFTFLTILLILILHNHSFSQIVCTDVSPDLVVSPSYSLDIDLNNDLTKDFRIISFGAPINYVYVVPNQIGITNFVLCNNAGGAIALTLNTIIGPASTTWQQMNYLDVALLNSFSSPPSGPWFNAIDKYLGLRFVAGANTYYGWARFTMINNTVNYIFKDYAYNSIPNQPILAGQGCAPSASPSFYLDANGCSGYTTNVTANTGTLSSSGYTWSSNPTGALFSAPNASVTDISFPATGNFSINLSISSPTSINTQKTIYIASTPTIMASISPTAFCFLNFSPTTTFTISANGASTYTFIDVGSPPFSNTVWVGTQYIGTFYTTTPFYVVGELNGCTSYDTVSILGLPSPDFSITAPASLCSGASATLVASDPSLTYTWIPNSSTLVVTGSSLVITPTVFPAYYTLYGDDGTCINTNGVSINEKKLNMSINSSFVTICAGESHTIVAAGATTYSWSPPYGLNTTVGYSVIASPSLTTNYTVTGTTGPCVTPLELTQDVTACTGLNEISQGEKVFQLHPNPAMNRLYINTNSELSYQAEVYDLDGKMILKMQSHAENNADNFIDVHSLPVGVYVVKIIRDDKIHYITKMIKE